MWSVRFVSSVISGQCGLGDLLDLCGLGVPVDLLVVWVTFWSGQSECSGWLE